MMSSIQALRRPPRAGTLAVLTLCFVVGTLVGGWWGVPVVGAGWGVWSSRATSRATAVASWAAACAVAAWVCLLCWTAFRGPLVPLVRTLGALFGGPGFLLVGLTLAFAALLAWSSAACFAAKD